MSGDMWYRAGQGDWCPFCVPHPSARPSDTGSHIRHSVGAPLSLARLEFFFTSARAGS